MASWETTFESDTLSARPAATVAGAYGTQTWYSGPAGTTSDASVGSSPVQSGSKAVQVSTTATGATYYSVSSIAATTYLRAYIYLTAAPGAANIIVCRLANGGYAKQYVVGITTDRRLYVTAYTSDALSTTAGTSNYTSAANSLPLSEWFRIEAKLTQTAVHGKLWKTTGGGGYNSSGAADLDSTELTGTSIGTSAQIQLGFESNTTMFSGGAAALDSLKMDDTAWIGPNAAASGTSYAGIVRI